MLLQTSGIPYLIESPIVAKATRNPYIDKGNYILIGENEVDLSNIGKFRGFLTHQAINNYRIDKPSVYSVGTFDHLAEDDIIAIYPTGVIRTLYRVKSFHNFLLFTERCNSNCLMCSQPPKDKDDTDHLYNIYSQLIPLIPKDCFELGITGGEPTLMGKHYFQLLKLIKSELPDTEIHCLTNGRSFAWKGMVEKLRQIEIKRLMLGIPLYADYHQIHDYIVQAKGAFNQTMTGLYNLAAIDQRIEIRIVFA